MGEIAQQNNLHSIAKVSPFTRQVKDKSNVDRGITSLNCLIKTLNVFHSIVLSSEISSKSFTKPESVMFLCKPEKSHTKNVSLSILTFFFPS